MKLVNTPSRRKIIPFAGALIDVPVKTNFLAINATGHVYSCEEKPKDVGGALFIPMNAILVAVVEGHSGEQVIDISNMAINFGGDHA